MKKMMKKVVQILLIVVLTLIGNTRSLAQSIDRSRMDRDLKVAENILATLAKEDSRNFWHNGDIESSYVPDYGVIFTMPLRTVMIYEERVEGYGQGKSTGESPDHRGG